MPKKRFSDEQIAFALRQAEAGTTVGENGGEKVDHGSGGMILLRAA